MKMTQLELRSQQARLKQLQKYLPTLQLKKALLQGEVVQARQAVDQVEEFLRLEKLQCADFASLLSEEIPFDLAAAVKVQEVVSHTENIAGIDLPVFEKVEFAEADYALEETPIWVDAVVLALRRLVRLQVQMSLVQERLARLEKELREVSTRVNLFEKILIPRTTTHIRKISVFLSDLQLAAVARAKVAKTKINEKKNACRA